MEPSPSSSVARSVLDSLGSDIIGVMSPVSICMFLVVILVSVLSPPSTSPSPSLAVHTAATLVYQESPSDSTSQKLEGALLNAAAFIALITAVTFLLVLLYYYNFTGFLKHYMRFSAFVVLASMGGSILVSFLRRFSLPLDSISFGIILFNFSAVGVFGVLTERGFPIVMRQGYMVTLGIIVAAWFTKLPEWTTWTLLMALALYDLVAVLAPGGPLKLLVELASSRDEELPALIYEARPSIASVSGPARTGSLELQPMPPPLRMNPTEVVNLQMVGPANTNVEEPIVENRDVESETVPLVANASAAAAAADANVDIDITLVGADGDGGADSEDIEVFDMTRGIKLGLGDFVFYSVLVARAAMYDWMTVYACYLAVVSGLGCTLILLSVYRKALPALPISIMLGVAFYFLTRLLMEPFVVGSSSKLVMF